MERRLGAEYCLRSCRLREGGGLSARCVPLSALLARGQSATGVRRAPLARGSHYDDAPCISPPQSAGSPQSAAAQPASAFSQLYRIRADRLVLKGLRKPHHHPVIRNHNTNITVQRERTSLQYPFLRLALAAALRREPVGLPSRASGRRRVGHDTQEASGQRTGSVHRAARQ